MFVVDDDRQMREWLLALCAAMGFVARGFESGGGFRDFYRSEWPGGLVLDIQTPGQTGLELYEQLLRATAAIVTQKHGVSQRSTLVLADSL